MHFLEKRGVLYDLQHGFRKKRSCETQLISLYHSLTNARSRGVQTDLIVMDFAKAFDKVSHRHLAAKLDHYGIRGATKEWIINFLSNRTQRVMVEGKFSTRSKVTSGVPQGTVLGPILFLIYINDLPGRSQYSVVRLFADDCILQREIRSYEDCEKLQQDITAIGKWEKDWLMEFHPGKCHVLTVPYGKKVHNFQYKLHGHVLERPKELYIKYLGVTIQADLKWTSHINAITAKASRTLGLLRRNIRVPEREVRERAYKCLVRPQMEFASAVWDPPRNRGPSKTKPSGLCHDVESVQRRGARFVCRRYRNQSSPTEMMTELEWPKLETRRKYARLCMMYRVRHGLAAISFPGFLHPKDPRTRGHGQGYRSIGGTPNYWQDSFLPRTVRDWNSLDQHVVDAKTLDQFKSRLAAFLGM